MSLVYPDVKFVGGPTYDVGGTKLLFPFTYKNGVLDLPSSFSSTTAPANDGVQIRRLGGTNVVNSVGPTLKNYLLVSQIWEVTRSRVHHQSRLFFLVL